MGRKSIIVRVEIPMEGGAWVASVSLTTPPDTDRDLEPIRAEIVKRLPSWIKAKIEKG